MNPEQQRVAIAEACGWTVTHWKVNPFDVIATKDGTEYLLKHLPDYLNDLNAMHDVEKTVFRSSNLWQKFVFELIETSGGSGMCELDGLCCLARATAAQRAEAFLRTIGKWEEAK